MALIIPEVFADAVNAELGKRLIISKLAKNYSDDVDITTCGNTVHFPVFNRISGAKVLEDGGTATFEDIAMTDNTAEVKQHYAAVFIADKASIQVKGSAKTQLVEQLADAMSISLDETLAKSIVDTAAYKTEVESLGAFVANNFDAALEVFGDQQQISSFAGIAVNSKLYSSIAKWDEFVSAVKTYNMAGNGIVEDTGLVGFYRGIPVYLTDSGTSDESNAYAFLIKKGALGVVWQKVPSVEEHRNLAKIGTDILTYDLVAAKLLHTNGVSLISVKTSE